IELLSKFDSAFQWPGGRFICRRCRRNTHGSVRDLSISSSIRCNECGQDVSSEVGKGRRGTYICKSCLSDVKSDPLHTLFKSFVVRDGARAGPGPASIPGYEVVTKLGEGGERGLYIALVERRTDFTLH